MWKDQYYWIITISMMSKICDAFMFSANPSFLDAIIAVT